MTQFDPNSIDYTPLIRLQSDLPTAEALIVDPEFRVLGKPSSLVTFPFGLYALLDFTASYSTIAVFPKELIVNEEQLIQMHRCVRAIADSLADRIVGSKMHANVPRFNHAPNRLGYNRSVYIYAPELPIGAENVRAFFEARDLRPRVRDLSYYQKQWAARRPDVFISHDSADKAAVAEPLYHALTARGLKVWLDKYTLNLGDSLTEKINEGIAECRYGVLILSKAFLANERWAKRELNSFSVKDAIGDSHKLIPVWHNISESDLAAQGNYWLIDKLGGSSSDIEELADAIMRVVRP
ncbi:toll/interleukin-1 receptor domain-containing protein [Hymenobacter cheonanensis]|uniref:toll/interleukin-1 receptor domain-containing protein n=1 Tax=Hymenobacter sp. CA2-7 TaxID=3063993 RepID=UPI0027122666|nr:toll/interleukin-1 receptor domain-containing protein [Hymenobacter sp. CA2-7]MDO7888183.1 toll/interleukin-1 receptor domain-containing protein [Hymenobacter sp. CA2-7]